MNRIAAVFFALLFLVQITFAADDKIYGGSYATDGQFPFIIQLYDVAQGYFFCGGSLIGPYHVLTAAHCTEGSTASQIKIWGGSLGIYSGDGEYITVEALYQHPSYDSYYIENDLTVIKLSKPFAKATGLRTIAMSSSTVATGTDLTVAGWGKSENGYPYYLLYTSVPVISTTSCKSYNGYSDIVGASQICCYVRGSDSCQGDSGGPLFKGQGTAAVQHGIVSWGVGCAVKPGVYTRVSYFRNWIVSKSVHTVKTTCSSCANHAKWQAMCEQMGGTYSKSSSGYSCSSLDVDKTRKISYSWTGCTDTYLKDFCGKVGRFTCASGVGKCTRL